MTKTLSLSTTAANIGSADEIIPGTDWTYAQAASMRKECVREDRLFGTRHEPADRSRGHKHRSTRRARNTQSRRALPKGWTWEAMAAMHKECLRDRRLFGGSAIGANV
jgi:hypothetical protein